MQVPACMVFISHIWKDFYDILEVGGDLVSKWAMFKISITEVAGKTCCSKVILRYQGPAGARGW